MNWEFKIFFNKPVDASISQFWPIIKGFMKKPSWIFNKKKKEPFNTVFVIYYVIKKI